MFKFIVCISGHVCVHVWVCVLHPTLFMTLWNIAHQTSLSTEFPRQEYQSGLPFPSPENLPHPGIKPTSPALAGRFFTTQPHGKSINRHIPQQICLFDGRIIFSLTSLFNSAPIFTQHGFMTSKMHNYSFVEGELSDSWKLQQYILWSV